MDWRGDTVSQKWDLKYRPRTFEEVRGQPEKAHLRLLLRNKEQMPPLLLFRGPSGTGKTTIARIVAAGLNCTNLGPKSDPCTECDNCVAIFNHSFAGVYEHNAAFHNGADDMRELQQRSNLFSDGEFNVFILDEAQSLSSQAWKVLLKLFEEPPPGNVYVLVTSEPTKIPTTIQTRAISYDFGRIKPDEILNYLNFVQEQEGVWVEGASLIVDLAEGSARQAVKLLQQCARSGQSAYDAFADKDPSLDVWEAAASNDKSAGLVVIEKMWQGCTDPQPIMDQLALQLQKIAFQSYDLPIYTSERTQERLNLVAKALGEKKIALAFEVMAEWYPRSKTKAHLLFMWASLLKALHGATSTTTASPINRVAPVVPSAATAKVSGDDVRNTLENLRFE